MKRAGARVRQTVEQARTTTGLVSGHWSVMMSSDNKGCDGGDCGDQGWLMVVILGDICIQEIFHILDFLYIPVSFDFISGQDSRQSSADRVKHF